MRNASSGQCATSHQLFRLYYKGKCIGISRQSIQRLYLSLTKHIHINIGTEQKNSTRDHNTDILPFLAMS